MLFVQLFLKILSGMANIVDPDQSAPSVCTVCICHFVRNFGVQNFGTFTVIPFCNVDQLWISYVGANLH